MAATTPRPLYFDVLWGLAFLMACLGSLLYFVEPITISDFPPDVGSSPFDVTAHLVMHILFSAQVGYVMALAFGLGVGFAMERGDVPTSWLFAGFGALAVIGLLHWLLLWSGDRLLGLGFLGMLVIPIVRTVPITWLWRLAIGLIFLPVVFYAYYAYNIGWDPSVHAWWDGEVEGYHAALDAERSILASGSFTDNLLLRLDHLEWAFVYGHYWLPSLLGFILLGYALVASGIGLYPDRHQDVWRFGILVLIPVGLVLGAAAWYLDLGEYAHLPTPRFTLGYFLGRVAGVLLTLGALSIAALYTRELRWCAELGRLFYSLYLLLSVVWGLTLFGYGLGFIEFDIPPALQLGLGVATAFGLSVFGLAWSQRMGRGPVESLLQSVAGSRVG